MFRCQFLVKRWLIGSNSAKMSTTKLEGTGRPVTATSRPCTETATASASPSTCCLPLTSSKTTCTLYYTSIVVVHCFIEALITTEFRNLLVMVKLYLSIFCRSYRLNIVESIVKGPSFQAKISINAWRMGVWEMVSLESRGFGIALMQ